MKQKIGLLGALLAALFGGTAHGPQAAIPGTFSGQQQVAQPQGQTVANTALAQLLGIGLSQALGSQQATPTAPAAPTGAVAAATRDDIDMLHGEIQTLESKLDQVLNKLGITSGTSTTPPSTPSTTPPSTPSSGASGTSGAAASPPTPPPPPPSP